MLAPVLVVGLLLTSLVTLHNLKDTKKDNVFRIGISQYITHKSLDATRKGFIEELKKEGYVDGKNIQIDFQNAQGEQRNLKNISKQLAEESDLVFAIATPSAQSLANTTKTTPVVFSAVTDPLAAKLVKNLKEPGGNITGTSDQSEDAISTQVDMIKQVLPTAKTVGILYTQSEPNSVVQKDNAKKILEAKGYQVVEKTILDSNNVKAAADSIMSEADIVFVPTAILSLLQWTLSNRFLSAIRCPFLVDLLRWWPLVVCTTLVPIMRNWGDKLLGWLFVS